MLEEGFYYLVIERARAGPFLEKLKSICANPRFADATACFIAITVDVKLGDLGGTIEFERSVRQGERNGLTPLLRTAVEGSSRFRTICLYIEAPSDTRGAMMERIQKLDDGWRDGAAAPEAGFISSISSIGIGLDSIDASLVASLACHRLWHPALEDPAERSERFDTLMKKMRPELPAIEALDLSESGNGVFPLIETKDLTYHDLPTDEFEWFDYHNDSDPRSVMRFALSFDGYAYLGSDVFEFLDVVERVAFGGQPRILTALNTTGLRALLFALQRRHHNADDGLETDALTRAIVRQLRTRLS